MSRRAGILKFVIALAGIVLLALAVVAYGIYDELQKSISEDPLVWEKEIQAFEQAVAEYPPPGEYVLFVGSSSIRLWSSLARDMAPIPVVNRGFGGAKLYDLVHYTERLVNALQPRALVVFAGTNDITVDGVKQPQVLLASYREFVARVHRDLPRLPIYYIAITPSPRRWAVWPEAQAANQLIEQYTQSDARLHFIDTGAALLGEDGTPNEDNYLFDGLHLSEQGYAIWRGFIRDKLLQQLPDYRPAQQAGP